MWSWSSWFGISIPVLLVHWCSSHHLGDQQFPYCRCLDQFGIPDTHKHLHLGSVACPNPSFHDAGINPAKITATSVRCLESNIILLVWFWDANAYNMECNILCNHQPERNQLSSATAAAIQPQGYGTKASLLWGGLCDCHPPPLKAAHALLAWLKGWWKDWAVSA